MPSITSVSLNGMTAWNMPSVRSGEPNGAAIRRAAAEAGGVVGRADDWLAVGHRNRLAPVAGTEEELDGLLNGKLVGGRDVERRGLIDRLFQVHRIVDARSVQDTD